jgi:tetratricopeptide (TPR) repeat protein
VSNAPSLAQVLETAVRHHQGGNVAEAERLYRSVLDQDPNQTDALNLLGFIVQQAGDLDQALGLFDRAMAAAPDLATIPFNKGNALRDSGHQDEARDAYEAALTIDPKYEDALLNLGVLLHEGGDTAAAMGRFNALLALDPDNAQAHYNLGKCRQSQGRLDEAEDALAKATTLDPGFPDAHFAQANVLAALGKLNAAIRHINTATKLKPNWAEAYNNWGNYLFDLDRHEDAVEKYGHALSMDQDNMNCRVNRGLALLTLGNLEAGWEAYRVRGLSDAPYYRASGKELTAGKEDFEGKDVLVGNEQGLGDEILYAGMLEECAQLTRTCTFACSKKLFPLFERSFADVPQLNIVKKEAGIQHLEAFDFSLSLVDLGEMFRPSLSAFPEPRPYLKWDQERAFEFRNKYRRSTGPEDLLIGISWASSNPIIGDQKTVPLDKWQPILTSPGVRFINLQTGSVAEELDTISMKLGVEIINDTVLDTENDLDGALSQIAAMDLVITCSNTTAHLAGAAGVPAWVLLSTGRARLWYWFLEGQASPWYRNLKLYRKTPQEDWNAITEGVARDLRSLHA